MKRGRIGSEEQASHTSGTFSIGKKKSASFVVRVYVGFIFNSLFPPGSVEVALLVASPFGLGLALLGRLFALPPIHIFPPSVLIPTGGCEESFLNGTSPTLTPAGSAKAASPLLSPQVPRVDLQGAELWKRFHEIGTEMIITKAGR